MLESSWRRSEPEGYRRSRLRGWSRVLMAPLVLLLGLLPLAGSANASAAVPVRVLEWNIWHGGKDPAVGGAQNLPRLIDQLVALQPDVFFAIETYGSAEEIRTGLSRRAGKGVYSATRITSGASDNLWIFTHYPVVEVYPKPTGSVVSDFNLGGVRVRLPNGRQLNLFDTWLSYSNPWIGDLVDENAHNVRAGKKPPHSTADVVAAEESRQLPNITDIVDVQLPRMLRGNTDPTVLAGDLNTVPSHDWEQGWAGCRDHFGMAFPLRTTKKLTDAGFVDTFRAANPDVCSAPGRTWSPQPEYDHMIMPDRIDFVFAKGRTVSTTRSFVVGQRLPQHGPGRFYSDHAAVVSDLLIG
ncbi:hypothetical protein GCM10012275_16870 [Longimycelium tulufanense]|uniref:Endonuclease/exonuclease/phosphatase domain-containing protein n=1 Tax=Longimycelium tulufanense TaxID=907463 RepID=A0A8J3CBY7_9PSEU|nr:hypothetical protein GCM10012275_16870 [Longimycelium tulufanense]